MKWNKVKGMNEWMNEWMHEINGMTGVTGMNGMTGMNMTWNEKKWNEMNWQDWMAGMTDWMHEVE